LGLNKEARRAEKVPGVFMSRAGGSEAGDLTLAFLLGAAVGAAVALLFAPAPGRETREFLGQKAREGQDKAAELAKEAWTRQRETLGTAVERGRDAFQQARSQTRDKEPA
jgi:gas vesicle protein